MYDEWGEKGNTFKLLAGKPQGKRPLGIPTPRLDNIKVHLGKIRWGCVDSIGLVQDRDKWRALVKSVMNLRGHKQQ
jgi:hypothetical protein